MGGAGRARGDETSENTPAETWTLHFRIGYPSLSTFKCPVCDVNYTTLASLRRHVKTKHERYTLSESFACDECDEVFDIIKKIKAHRTSTHGAIAPPPAPNGAFLCSFCPLHFFTKVSLGQHLRGSHMEQASQARAEAAAAAAVGKRKLWDPVEVEAFMSALLSVGPSSNIAIAKIVGTKTSKQVGIFKHKFFLKHPTWIADHQPTANAQTPPRANALTPSSANTPIPSTATTPKPSSANAPMSFLPVAITISNSNSNLNLTPPPPSPPSPHVNVSSPGVSSIAAQFQPSSPSPHLNVSSPGVSSIATQLQPSSPPPHLNVSHLTPLNSPDMLSAVVHLSSSSPPPHPLPGKLPTNALEPCLLSPQCMSSAIPTIPVTPPPSQLHAAYIDAIVTPLSSGAYSVRDGSALRACSPRRLFAICDHECRLRR